MQQMTDHDATYVAPHGHQVELDVGLDFINTLEYVKGRPLDHLDSLGTALRWFLEHDLLHRDMLASETARLDAEPEAATRALQRIRRVREAMRELADAAVERRTPAQKQLDEINRALRTPYSYYLVPAPDGVSLDHKHIGDPIDGALARLAESLAREVSQGHPERLRICDNDECRWVFNDTSRSGRRRWCDMSTCGNRAKAARHRERQRSVDQPAAVS